MVSIKRIRKKARKEVLMKSLQESAKSTSAGVAAGIVMTVAPDVSFSLNSLLFLCLVVLVALAYAVFIHWLAENAFDPEEEDSPQVAS